MLGPQARPPATPRRPSRREYARQRRSTRDTDTNSSVNYTLTHNAVAEMTDDRKDYEYIAEAFGRLRKVTTRTDVLMAEYGYNGLGFRISWHYDTTQSGGAPPRALVILIQPAMQPPARPVK
jgi:hypothetical protein